jgi:hypothetical protein
MTNKIILLDSSETILKVIELAVEKYELDVFSYPNIEEVIKSVSPNRSDIVIIESNIIDNKIEIKKLVEISKLVLLKGSLEKREDKFFFDIGFLKILSKPFNSLDLERVLSDLEVNSKFKELPLGDVGDKLTSNNEETNIIISKICDAMEEQDSQFKCTISKVVKSCIEKELPLLVENYCRESLKSTIQKVLRQEIQNINKDLYS